MESVERRKNMRLLETEAMDTNEDILEPNRRLEEPSHGHLYGEEYLKLLCNNNKKKSEFFKKK
jgi:hypothetical protein